MTHYKPLLLLLLTLLCALSVRAQHFTYDDVAAGRFRPTQLAGTRSTADGEHYTVLRKGNIFRYSYALSEVGEPLLPMASNGDLLLDSLDVTTGEWMTVARRLPIVDYDIASDGGVLLSIGATPIYRHSYTTRYYYYDGHHLREILHALPDKRDAHFASTGRQIVLSSHNDLYLYDLDNDTLRRVTTDGRWNATINGTTDWVYEEEFGFTCAYALSPDARYLAYLKFDESRVPLMEMMRYDGALYNHAFQFKYPKAGDANSVVSLCLFDQTTGKTLRIDTGADSTQYIPRLGWTPQGELWYETRNRQQNHICFRRLQKTDFEAPQSAQEHIYSEFSDRYIAHETDQSFRWIEGGKRYLLQQETYTRWMHLIIGRPGGAFCPITSGNWEVTSIVGVRDDRVYYLSTESSPLERQLYSIDFAGKHKQRLTTDSGFHTVVPGAGLNYYIVTGSSAQDPGRVEVCDNKGRTVRVVADNAALRRYVDSIQLPRKEFFTLKTERGDTLNGYLLRPTHFDASKRYPCLLTQYSGPGSQSVQNRWRIDWEDVLVQQGYVVVCVDGRGTGFRGENFKKITYGQLGRYEVEDQLSVAHYMATQPWIDASRIGIYGWSYGGFMALSCACRGDGLFKVAIAVAPVTSWRYYDTIYTELYNGLPQTNAAGYDDNSPLQLAPLLRDDCTRLLLIHGTADDNVHFQNSVEMIRALTDAGKEFDLMVYPDQNHSMFPSYTRQIRKRMIHFIEQHL
jgi:dipeptidyl-peptidase-4